MSEWLTAVEWRKREEVSDNQFRNWRNKGLFDEGELCRKRIPGAMGRGGPRWMVRSDVKSKALWRCKKERVRKYADANPCAADGPEALDRWAKLIVAYREEPTNMRARLLAWTCRDTIGGVALCERLGCLTAEATELLRVGEHDGLQSRLLDLSRELLRERCRRDYRADVMEYAHRTVGSYVEPPAVGKAETWENDNRWGTAKEVSKYFRGRGLDIGNGARTNEVRVVHTASNGKVVTYFYSCKSGRWLINGAWSPATGPRGMEACADAALASMTRPQRYQAAA